MKWTLLLYIVLGLVIAIFLLLQHPIFGKSPSGDRLRRIKQSPHYRNGQFQNLSLTPQLTEGATMHGLLFDMVMGKRPEGLRPTAAIPHVQTNLHALQEGTLVWFGHSSYIFKTSGKVILVDPVLSGSASPFPGLVKAFEGSNVYTPADLPAIDYLIITHDHYDHLDYRTLKELLPRVKQAICGLGVGAHLEHWGLNAARITELDWWETKTLAAGMEITATPARHFSGRALRRNQTLWCSFVLKSADYRLFIGGDSGYDTHFKEIGARFGPFDLAILENGQYNLSWKHIHTLPEEIPAVVSDLQAKAVLPVHFGKFTLALHPWDEPPRLARKYLKNGLLSPQIGEALLFRDSTQVFQNWWENVTQ